MPSVEAGQTTLACPSILPYHAYPCESDMTANDRRRSRRRKLCYIPHIVK